MQQKKYYTCIKLMCTVLCIMHVFTLNAQVIPNTQTQPPAATQALAIKPAAYTGNTPLNYMRVWDVTKPLTLETDISALSVLQDVKQTTQYTDGLGRPLQTVVKSISPAGFDMVTPSLYDAFGNEVYKYMPYVSASGNGMLKSDPFTGQDDFLRTVYNPANNASGEKFFYSKTDYETSPLNRVTKTYAPGNSWIGNNIGTGIQYLLNAFTDSVLIWNIGFTVEAVPASAGFYSEGQLTKMVITDERGNKTIEYKDNYGLVILKKVQSSTSPGNGYTGWFCTYYIYDDFGLLRYVIPPKATDLLKANNWSFAATPLLGMVSELCFGYEYDDKGRMVTKKIPGGGKVYMVYDARDRMVMTQDSALRAAGKWLYTDYDSLNRPVLSGLWTITGDRVYHQGAAANSITYPTPATGAANEVLTETYYDNYSWVSGSGSGLQTALIGTYNTNTNYFYTSSNTVAPYARGVTANYQVSNMATGTKTKVLGTSTYLYAVNFYDDRGRILQTQSTNNKGAKDTLTMQYSFSGQVLRSFICHAKAGATAQYYQVLTKMTYDAAGRATQVNKKTGSSPEVIIVKNQYDELGQLKKKVIGQIRNNAAQNTYTNNPVDSLRFSYNIRGWLNGINKDYARNENSALNWFGIELCYDYGFNTTQLNGNIAGMRWRSGGDGEQRAYGFSYDAVNRLSKADFTQYTNTAWNVSAGIDYSLHSMSYDQNGNILTMNQMGLKLNTSLLIDSLVYGYNANSNRLQYVTDKVNDTSSHLGDFTEIGNNLYQDYLYDGNGSITRDNNKNIDAVTYNYLNLPDFVRVTGKGWINYLYDAAGNKLRKTVTDTAATPDKITVTDYMGMFTYQNDTLQFVAQEEGRARPAKRIGYSDTMYYDYFEKDHLGNTRIVLTDQLQQDVYPAATLENNSNAFSTENNYYGINNSDTISVSRIPWWGSTTGKNYLNNNGNPPYNNNPDAAAMATSGVVYKLNGATGDKTGLGITLKVMAGDVVDIFAKSFWHSNGVNPDNSYVTASALTGFVNAFAGSLGAGGSVKGATGSALNGSAATAGGLNSWLGTVPNPSAASVPKAYINWILFDEQFKPVISGSGFDLINTTADAVKSHQKTVSISKSGYLYVYCSNESNVDVFFDNLQVIHTKGALLESTDYYPFGLTMAGISSKALNFGGPENKKNKFQGQEYNDDLGVDIYEFKYRMDDPQIGRFWQIDPLANKYVYNSTYAFSENKVTGHVELEGLEAVNVVNNPKNHHDNTVKQIEVPSSSSSSSTTYSEKTLVPNILTKIPTIDVNQQVQNVSETNTTTTSQVMDLTEAGAGQQMVTTTQTTTTTVTFDATMVEGNTAPTATIAGISVTTNSITTFTKVVSADQATNTAVISVLSKDQTSSSSTPITTNVPLSGRLSTDLGKLSKTLENKTIQAMNNNNISFKNDVGALKKMIQGDPFK